MNARAAYIVLNRIEGIGPVRTRALVEALGSPEAVLEASPASLAAVRGIGPKVAEKLAARGLETVVVDFGVVGDPPFGPDISADDVARAVMFFADPANSFVTGQTLFVCGGASVSSITI